MIFDNIEVDSTSKEDADVLSKFYGSLEKLLKTVFKSGPKTEYRDLEDRINFACPYCFDSERNEQKKRGNLYKDNLFYVCYNCGKRAFLDSFLEHHKIDGYSQIELDLLKSNIHNNIQTGLFSSGTSFLDTIDIGIDVNKLCISKQRIMDRFGLYKPSQKPYVMEYLKKRKQHIHLGRRVDDVFAFSPKYDSLWTFNTNKEGKVIGAMLKNGVFMPSRMNPRTPRFKLMNWSDLMGKLGVENIRDEITKIMDPLSELYNIFFVNFSREYVVTEGIMDCNVLENSFAICGATKNFNIPGKYFMDNDPAGKTAAVKAMDAGNEIFLWDKFFDEKIGDPEVSANIKDVNDIIAKTDIPENQLYDYFSKDHMDLIWL